jgi:hypothetical protein
LACNQYPTGEIIDITFRGNENVIITDPLTTTINLQTPDATGINKGAKFYLLRQTSSTDITINAPTNQTVGFYNTSNVYTTASSYMMSKFFNNLTLICVGNSGTSWLIINNTAINSLYLPNQVSTLAPTATTLSAPYYNYYTFTSATANTTLTLPTITTGIIGCPLTFRRAVNASFQLIIKTASGSGTTIIQRASISETPVNTNYTFLSTTQFIGTIMAISLTKWSVVT